MSLFTALDSGASGLDTSSLQLDVIGNNISNADTVGFKEGSADFEAAMSENLIGSSSGQIGLGSQLQQVQQIITQGSLQTTGNNTDMAIQGGGMFVVQGSQNGMQGSFYTRDGQFTIDNSGNLVTQGGLDVQGYTANAAGVVSGTLGNLQVGDATSPPNPTTTVTMEGNLASNSPAPSGGTTFDVTNPVGTSNTSQTSTVYDSLGNPHQVQVYFTQTSPGNWTWNAVTDGGGLNGGTAGTAQVIASGTLSFDATGKLTTETQSSNFNPAGATDPQALTFNFGDPTSTGGTGEAGLTQYASSSGTSAFTFNNQDGYGSGTLSGISVGADGTITGAFSNGQSKSLGQVALANFAAPDQLTSVGGNMFQQTQASGQPTIGAAGSGGRGSIADGSLEQSNVDMSDQFIQMIGAQRDFQADSRTVTTADQMLQTLMTMAQG